MKKKQKIDMWMGISIGILLLDKGSRIRLQVKKEKINLFTEDGSKSLMR